MILRKNLLMRCNKKFNRLIAEHGVGKMMEGIGVGAPNANYYRGTIEQAPNLPWKGNDSFCGFND